MATTSEKGSEQVLVFPNLVPSLRISLPFLAPPEYGNLSFTDCDGNPLQFSEDVEYRSARHRLLWLDYNRPEDKTAEIHLYFERFPGERQPRPLPGERAPEDVLFFADFFRSDTDATLDGLLDRWTVSVGTGRLRRRGGTWVSIVPYPVEAVTKRRDPAPNCGASPSALCLDPSHGDKQIVVHRKVSLAHSGLQRIHFRGYFYDNGCASIGAEGAHWIGISVQGDGGAVGLSSADPRCYCSLKKFNADAPGEGDWISTGIPRSRGWHLFAIEFQECSGMILVDKKRVAKMADLPALEVDCLFLGASGSAAALWGGVELLHIPLNRGLWEELDASPASDAVLSIWKVEAEPTESPKPVEKPVLASECVKEESAPEPGETPAMITEESPAPKKVKARASRRGGARRRSPSPASAVAGLQIECWSLPGETALRKLDRVMGVFLDKLQEAHVALPDNITRLEDCSEPGHSSCYVYSFGTRRLHISTRDGEGGRLTLVVRCGGGYLDFMDFAARHGRVEDLKLKRLTDSKGHERIQLTSVMSHGAVRLTESTGMNSTMPVDSARPGTADDKRADTVAASGIDESCSDSAGSDRIKAVFRRFDLNNDGMIEKAELTQVLQELDAATWNPDRCELLLSEMDADRDGALSYCEFVDWAFETGTTTLKQDFRSIIEKLQPGCFG